MICVVRQLFSFATLANYELCNWYFRRNTSTVIFFCLFLIIVHYTFFNSHLYAFFVAFFTFQLVFFFLLLIWCVQKSIRITNCKNIPLFYVRFPFGDVIYKQKKRHCSMYYFEIATQNKIDITETNDKTVMLVKIVSNVVSTGDSRWEHAERV